MGEITTRAALPADIDVLLSFEQGIVNAERPFDPTLKDGIIHYYDLAQLITAPDVKLIVAELDGQIIGSGYARVESSKVYLKHPQHCYLGFMYTRPEFRGRGVNSLILNALKEWALTQQVTELRLQVYYENEVAVKAYQKAGFTPNLMVMRMELDK